MNHRGDRLRSGGQLLHHQPGRDPESRGCRFVPATREQIATLAMQRRVFWVDGQAFLALQPDGFLETAATLQRLLKQPLPAPVCSPIDPQPTAPACPDPDTSYPPQLEAGQAEVSRLPPEEARSRAGAPARVSSPVPPPPSLPVQPVRPSSQAALVETVQLVSACLSTHPVPQEELEALIRATHQAVLRMRAAQEQHEPRQTRPAAKL
jgi:hypothetical protein